MSKDCNWEEKVALDTWFWGCAWVQGSQGYKDAEWSTESGLVNKQEIAVSTGLPCFYKGGSWVLNKASSPIQVFSALADGDIDHPSLPTSERLCLAYALECLRMKCLSWNALQIFLPLIICIILKLVLKVYNTASYLVHVPLNLKAQTLQGQLRTDYWPWRWISCCSVSSCCILKQ